MEFIHPTNGRQFGAIERVTLFGERELHLVWGRRGGKLRVRALPIVSDDELARALREIAARRRLHGYVRIA